MKNQPVLGSHRLSKKIIQRTMRKFVILFKFQYYLMPFLNISSGYRTYPIVIPHLDTIICKGATNTSTFCNEAWLILGTGCDVPQGETLCAVETSHAKQS